MVFNYTQYERLFILIKEDEQETNKDYGVHRPVLLPLLVCPIPFPSVLDLILYVLHVGLQQYLKHMVTLSPNFPIPFGLGV